MNTFCRIFVNSTISQEEMKDGIVLALGAVTRRSSIVTEYAEFDLTKNESADSELSRSFPDGFVYFNFTIEVELTPSSDLKNYFNQIGTLLLFFWDNNHPAVAACDFESDLPFSGGFKNISLPWPGKKN